MNRNNVPSFFMVAYVGYADKVSTMSSGRCLQYQTSLFGFRDRFPRGPGSNACFLPESFFPERPRPATLTTLDWCAVWSHRWTKQSRARYHEQETRFCPYASRLLETRAKLKKGLLIIVEHPVSAEKSVAGRSELD